MVAIFFPKNETTSDVYRLVFFPLCDHFHALVRWKCSKSTKIIDFRSIKLDSYVLVGADLAADFFVTDSVGLERRISISKLWGRVGT